MMCRKSCSRSLLDALVNTAGYPRGGTSILLRAVLLRAAHHQEDHHHHHNTREIRNYLCIHNFTILALSTRRHSTQRRRRCLLREQPDY